MKSRTYVLKDFMVYLKDTSTYVVGDHSNVTTTTHFTGTEIIKAVDKHSAWHKAADIWGAECIQKVVAIRVKIKG